MEMLRTIVVALTFAGITVCTYYYLNSSQFPWEIGDQEENVAQTPENPAGNALPAPELNDSGPSTFAQDGPFAPLPPSLEDEDNLPLPGMNELPLAEGPTDSEGTPMVAASTAQLPTQPISDNDLPSLSDQQTSSPFDKSPAAVQAQHQGQIGSNARMEEETQALPAPKEETNTDFPPAPSFETNTDSDFPTPAPLPAPPTSNPNQNTGAVTNPLRQNSPPPAPVPTPQTSSVPQSTTPQIPAQAPSVSPSPDTVYPPMSNPNPAQGPAPYLDQTNEEAEAAAETAAIREYLKIAKEKIQKGQALEVLRQLSKFYGNPRFTAEESSELVDILVLAATQVIYSQKSFIDEPYTVLPGDTIEKIAALYNIPPEFIMRVNGLQSGAPLEPGRQLKVVHGPFRVLVYLDRHEMILTLNGLFAGRFWIGIGSELVQKDSDFSFTGKSVTQIGNVPMPCCDFVLTSGEPDSAQTIKIQVCTDPNAIGSSAPTGMILMSQTDVQNLCAILGPKSELLLRCHSLKASDPQTIPDANPAQAYGSSPAQAPAQAYGSAPAPAPTPAVSVPAPAPAYGASAELPGTLPDTLPDSLPAPATAPAMAPADELPLELPATL